MHPFTLLLLAPSGALAFSTPITFLVGENGSGKSTLLEGLAWALGSGVGGDNRENSDAEGVDGHRWGARCICTGVKRLQAVSSCVPKPCFNFAAYLDEVGSIRPPSTTG